MSEPRSEPMPVQNVVYTVTCDGEQYHVLQVTREVLSTHATFSEAMSERSRLDVADLSGRSGGSDE